MENKSFWSALLSRRMLVIFFLGFASGLPLTLTGATLKLWLTREGVDLSQIGYFTWVSMSYSLKFLWAPILDRFSLTKFGRRRSWMLLSQFGLIASIAGLGFLSPQTDLQMMAVLAVIVAFFSATQDIAIDAYRREYLTDRELGLASSLNIYGYRVAMLISNGVGVSLVGSEFLNLTWQSLYILMAALMGLGVLTTLLAEEPKIAEGGVPKTLWDAVVDPFLEFLKRPGSYYILLFVFLYKFGDAMGGAMLSPFYVQMGYSNADIGLIAKSFGLFSSLLGLFLGGTIIYKIGIYRGLWIFGILQALSTASFALITWTGPEKWALAVTVVFEDMSQGMGSAAFVAFIAKVCNRRYTATQYAILSSVATLGRNFFSGFSGEMVKYMGWAPFFYFCMLLAVPGLVLLFKLAHNSGDDQTGL